MGIDEPAYPVAAVDRALRTVQLLHRNGCVRVQTVARELDVAPSTAHRLLAMLVHRGFAVQDRAHVYWPGEALRELQEGTRRTSDPLRVARPHLEALAQECGETVHLMVLEGTGARFVDGVESPQALRVALRVGVVLPAHVTSGGKAMLAELGARSLAELYPRGLPLTRGAQGPDLRALRTELTLVRRRGYALNVEESERGVHAVGVAVRHPDGGPAAAIVVAAPASRLPRRALGALAVPVLATARTLTEQLADAATCEPEDHPLPSPIPLQR